MEWGNTVGFQLRLLLGTKKQSLSFTIKNNMQLISALAFFHIPLPEYKIAFDNEKNVCYGVRLEQE